MRVYKYQFEIKDGPQHQRIHKGGKILSTHMQGRYLCAWALVDPHELPESRTFFVFGTGQGIKPGLEFVGTVMHGDFVWHLFEEPSS